MTQQTLTAREQKKEKQILKGEHRHTNHIENGQRVRRSLWQPGPALLCFNFFPTAQKNEMLCQPANGTTCPYLSGFAFVPPTSIPFSKHEALTNTIKININLSKAKRTVFCQRTDYNCKLETVLNKTV